MGDRSAQQHGASASPRRPPGTGAVARSSAIDPPAAPDVDVHDGGAVAGRVGRPWKLEAYRSARVRNDKTPTEGTPR